MLERHLEFQYSMLMEMIQKLLFMFVNWLQNGETNSIKMLLLILYVTDVMVITKEIILAILNH